jgi:hypothetical protein
MNPDVQHFLQACGVACALQTILCISFIGASELTFSRSHVLAAHCISLLAGISVLALRGSFGWAALVSFTLIALPALVGCYCLALHAHNSVAFRLLHEIGGSSGISFDELLGMRSSQELNVRRRLEQLIQKQYVVLVGENVFPTRKGLRITKYVELLRRLFYSSGARNPLSGTLP